MWQEHADPLQSPQIQGCNRLLQPILSCGHVRQAQLLLGSCTAVKLAVGGSWELLRQALPSSEMLRMPSAAGAAVSLTRKRDVAQREFAKRSQQRKIG